MSYTPIDQVPTALRSQSQKVFDDAMAGFFTQLPRAISQLNTAGQQTNDNAATAQAAAVIATAQAGAAQAAVDAHKWIADTAYADGDQAWSPINGQSYRRRGAGAGAIDPALDAPNWSPVVNPIIATTEKFADYTAVALDKGRNIACMNTMRVNFASAATLGNGWYCYVQNRGTGLVTLDPFGSETIGGASVATLPPGYGGLVIGDGVNLWLFMSVPQDFRRGVELLGAAKITAPVAQVDFLNIFTADYDRYTIELVGFLQPPRLRMAVAGVVDAGASSYATQMTPNQSSSTAVVDAVYFATTSSGRGYNTTIDITNPRDATALCTMLARTVAQTSATPGWSVVSIGAAYLGNGPASGFRLFSFANFTVGTVRVYGHRNNP